MADQVLNLSAPDTSYGGLGWRARLNCNIQRDNTDVAAFFGEYTLKVTSTTSSGSMVIQSAGGENAPSQIDTGSAVSASVEMKINEAKDTNISILFYGSDGAVVGRTRSTDTNVSGTASWTQLSVTENSPPSNAVTACIEVEVKQVSNSTIAYFDGAIVRNDATTDFVPSHRITKDLDIRAKITPKHRDSSALQSIVGHYDVNNDNKAYLFGLYGLTPRLYWTEDGTTIAYRVATQTISTGYNEPVHLRATLDADDGANQVVITFFESTDGEEWQQIGDQLTIAGAISLYNSAKADLTFGIHSNTGDSLRGLIHESEVRDGIDGSIIARFDADNPSGLAASVSDGTAYTDLTTGHSVKLNASGDATTEIVDQDCWAFTGTELLEFPDQDALDIDSNDDFAAFTNYFTRNQGLYRSWMRKTAPDGNTRWSHRNLTSTQRPYTDLNDGTTTYSSSSSSPGVGVVGAWALTGFEHDGSAGNTRDITESTDGPWDSTLPAGDSVADSGPYEWMNGQRGLASWNAIFRRMLTTSERNALRAWDGSVATEPVWLRPLAVFYINANDPWVKKYYNGEISTNEVLNLATAPYGELGWHAYADQAAEQQPDFYRTNSVEPVVGSMVLRMRSYDQNYSARLQSDAVGPVTPGETYSASANVWTSTVNGRNVTPILVWMDEEEGEIDRTIGASQSINGSNEHGDTRPSVEGTAPAGAAKIAIEFECDAASNWYFFDAVTVRKGSDTGYVPSLRVREDLDVQFYSAASSWTPNSDLTLIGRMDSGSEREWRVDLSAAGVVQFGYSVDGSTFLSNNYQNIISGLTDGEPIWVRSTRSASDGVHTAFDSNDGVSWNQRDQDTGLTTGSFQSVSNQVVIGGLFGGSSQNLKGAVLVSRIRDGIDGPILLDLDIAEWPDDSDTYTMPNGLTAEIVRAGDETAEIVDRNTWAFTGSEYLSLDDSYDLVDDFSIIAHFETRSSSTASIIGNKRGSGGTVANGGYILHSQGNIELMAVVEDDNNGTAASSTDVDDGIWHSAVADRKDGLLRMHLDGTTNEGATIAGELSDVDIEGLAIGADSIFNIPYSGLITIAAILHRTLTNVERQELAAWDGSIANEPEWLRHDPALVLYLNADDPQTYTAYQNDEVVNIASSLEIEGGSTTVPDTTEQVEVRVDSGTVYSVNDSISYPIASDVWTVFEANHGTPYAGIVDENGPWRNGTPSRPGNTNFSAKLFDSLSRDDFGIPHNEDYKVTWIGVENDNGRVLTWLESNTVEPANRDDELVYPESAVTESIVSNEYVYEPVLLRARIKPGVEPEWYPQVNSGYFYEDSDEYYFFAKKGQETTATDELLLSEVARQGAPIIVHTDEATPTYLRQVAFFDDSATPSTLSHVNEEVHIGDGSDKLFLAYDGVYAVDVNDSDGNSVTYSDVTDNVVTLDAATVDGEEYSVTYRVADSFYVEYDEIQADGTQKTRVHFDSAPPGGSNYVVNFEKSEFDPATPVDVPLNPLYTTQTEGFLYISFDEYDLSSIRTHLSPQKILADGVDYIVVTMRSEDENGNPKPNQSFTLSTDFGTLTETNITTDEDGFAVTVLQSSDTYVSDTGTLTITGDINDSIDFEIEEAKQAKPMLHAVVNSHSIQADGQSENTIYGKVQNADFTPVSGETVEWKRARTIYDLFSESDIFDSGSVTTDSDGVFEIGPITSQTTDASGYWFVATEATVDGEVIGDVIFWYEYPDITNGVENVNGLPIAPVQMTQIDASAIPDYTDGIAHPYEYKEDSTGEPATPVSQNWSPPSWYAVSAYKQWSKGMDSGNETYKST